MSWVIIPFNLRGLSNKILAERVYAINIHTLSLSLYFVFLVNAVVSDHDKTCKNRRLPGGKLLLDEAVTSNEDPNLNELHLKVMGNMRHDKLTRVVRDDKFILHFFCEYILFLIFVASFIHGQQGMAKAIRIARPSDE